MNRVTLTLASLALVVPLVVAGCGNGSGSKDSGNSSPDLAGVDLAGLDLAGVAMYPGGPYGTQVGDTIKDLTLRVERGAGGTFVDKKLSDYYADFVAGNLKVLAVVGAAYWCQPCKDEQPSLVKDWNDYKAKNAGVEFLVIVVENNNHMAATEMETNKWAADYLLPFDVGTDPNRVMAPYFDLMSFPNQLVIRLSDMTIQAFGVGNKPGWLTGAIDEALK